MGLTREFEYVEPRGELVPQICGKRSYNLSKIKAHTLNGYRTCKWCGKNHTPSKQHQYCSNNCYTSAFFYCRPHAHFSKSRVAENQDYKCSVCGKDISCGQFELDHIVPIFRGGNPFEPSNRQALCRNCHKEKTRQERKLVTPEREL